MSISKPSFEKLFEAIALCLERGLDVPSLVLTYTGLDALAWVVYGGDTPESKKRFLSFCTNYVFPLSQLECTAIDLYAARCSMLHSLGWESSLSEAGTAKAAHYSFGGDSKEVTQAAFDRLAPGRFFGIQADNLISAVIAAHRKVAEQATSDPALYDRLAHAEGKQYMSLDREVGERLFGAAAAAFDRGEI